MRRKRAEAMCQVHIPTTLLKTRPGGGKTLTYASTETIFSAMNRIFGLAWSMKTLENTSVGTAWKCVVEVTLHEFGVSRTGTGFGDGPPEKAMKEAESDAFKRACRSFGNALGLSLYDQEHLDAVAKEMKKK